MQPAAGTPEQLNLGAEAQGQPLPTLNVSGVVVTKVQLMEVLRVFVPAPIVVFGPLPGDDRYYIVFAPDK